MAINRDHKLPDSSGMAHAMPLAMLYYFGAPWLSSYSRDANNLRKFWENMHTMFQLYLITTKEKVEILIGKLGGTALKEVKSWPLAEKLIIEKIFERLGKIFDTGTIPEFKMQFFSLSLQEVLGAIQQVDPHKVQNTDAPLRDQFAYRARAEFIKTQLRILSLQNPLAVLS